MEMMVIDTLGAAQRHGYEFFGWCLACGSPSRYRQDVKARRTPKPATFDTDLTALIHGRGEACVIVGLAPIQCPRRGSVRTEMRITAPARPVFDARKGNADARTQGTPRNDGCV